MTNFKGNAKFVYGYYFSLEVAHNNMSAFEKRTPAFGLLTAYTKQIDEMHFLPTARGYILGVFVGICNNWKSNEHIFLDFVVVDTVRPKEEIVTFWERTRSHSGKQSSRIFTQDNCCFPFRNNWNQRCFSFKKLSNYKRFAFRNGWTICFQKSLN